MHNVSGSYKTRLKVVQLYQIFARFIARIRIILNEDGEKDRFYSILLSCYSHSHTVSGGMIAPAFESHQCLAGMWKRWLSCHAGRQEVGRCHTRGESQEMCNITCTLPLSSNKAEPTLALKPRGDVIRSPKQGYQWPHKRTHALQKFF